MDNKAGGAEDDDNAAVANVDDGDVVKSSSSSTYPYQCEIKIVLPKSLQRRSNNMAQELLSILSVDAEISDRVIRTFSIASSCSSEDASHHDDDDDRDKSSSSLTSTNNNNSKSVLIIQFAATEAKFLRVSVSSFTEYLNVALRGYQEFG